MLDRAANLWLVDWPTLDPAAAVTGALWALLVSLPAGAVWLIARALGPHPAGQEPRAEEDIA